MTNNEVRQMCKQAFLLDKYVESQLGSQDVLDTAKILGFVPGFGDVAGSLLIASEDPKNNVGDAFRYLAGRLGGMAVGGGAGAAAGGGLGALIGAALAKKGGRALAAAWGVEPAAAIGAGIGGLVGTYQGPQFLYDRARKKLLEKMHLGWLD